MERPPPPPSRRPSPASTAAAPQPPRPPAGKITKNDMSDFARSSAAPARNEDEGRGEEKAGEKERNDDGGEGGSRGGSDRRSGRGDHCRMEELWWWNETRTKLFMKILQRSRTQGVNSMGIGPALV